MRQSEPKSACEHTGDGDFPLILRLRDVGPLELELELTLLLLLEAGGAASRLSAEPKATESIPRLG